MSRTLIGRTVRRLRTERGLSQQALAGTLGISASYLNLI
jgi:transcriptional regulator with XRE-family HTH domain